MDAIDESALGHGFQSLHPNRQRALSVEWCQVSMGRDDQESAKMLPDLQVKATATSEVRDAVRLAVFIAASQCCRMALFSTDQAFVGYLGKAEIGGASLSRNWVSLTSTPISGAVASLNTLCSQATGAGNPKLAGLWVQLVAFVCLLLAIPTIVSFFFVDDIMALFVPACADSSICELAGTFSRWTSLTIAPMVLCKIIYVYFQALGVVSSAFWTSLLVIVINAGFNWLFVFGLAGYGGLGFIGSPIATTCSVLVQVAVFWLWTITYRQAQRPGWDGWDLREALAWRRVRQFLSQAGPAMLSLSLDRWAYQILALLVARYLSPTELAAHSVLNTIWGLLWSLNHGIAISTQIGVSLNLGRQRPAMARFRAYIGLAVNFFFMIATILALSHFRYSVGAVWSRSEEVVACVADTMPAYLFSAFISSFVLILERILDGMAHANLVAWVSALGQPWVPMLFMSDFLAQQAPGQRLTTVWLICAGTAASQALLLLFFLSCIGWERAAAKVIAMTDSHPLLNDSAANEKQEQMDPPEVKVSGPSGSDN